jgi:hypothetical protein
VNLKCDLAPRDGAKQKSQYSGWHFSGSRYDLAVEEFLAWQRSIKDYGLAGLRSTPLHRRVRLTGFDYLA